MTIEVPSDTQESGEVAAPAHVGVVPQTLQVWV